jgi:hypothetical protein
MRKTLALLLALSTVTVSAAAFAQGNADSNTAQCRGRANGATAARDQEFCFTDTDVHGTREGANGASTQVLRMQHGPSLIRHRAHFVPQMLVSVENF